MNVKDLIRGAQVQLELGPEDYHEEHAERAILYAIDQQDKTKRAIAIRAAIIHSIAAYIANKDNNDD